MAPFQEIMHQTLAIVPVGFNELIMGLAYAWTAPTLRVLEEPNSPITLTTEQSSWIGSLMELGRIFGPLISACLLDIVGRKLLGICTLIFCLAWLVIVFYKTVWAMYLLRLMIGIGTGINDVSSSIYLGEVASPKVRGFFCGLVMVGACSGELFEFIIATYLSYDAVAIINSILSFIGLITTFLLIESPQFLLIRGKHKQAKENYMWLKGTKKWEDVNAEFDKIRQNIEEETTKKESYWKLLADKVNRQSFILIVFLNFLTMATGFAALMSYASLAFSSSDALTPNEFTILLGVLQIFASIVTMLIIERFSRRTMALACNLLLAVSNATSAILYFVQDYVTPIEYFPWLIFFSISMYCAVFTALFTVVHIIRGELFPQSIKAFGGSVAIMVNAFTGFITARIFLRVAELFGMHINFLFFTVASLVAFFYTYFKLPETRGRTLVDIQKSMASL